MQEVNGRHNDMIPTAPSVSEVERVLQLVKDTPASREERPEWVLKGDDQDVCNVTCTDEPTGEGLEAVVTNLVGHVHHNHSNKRIAEVCHGWYDGMWAVFARMAPCC